MQKIGPSKADTRALKDHLAIQLDSPPPTPKSVRPPLSPLVEADLRAACAYVLQNFKPSHVVYEEQHGGAGQKQQLDYAAIKTAVHNEPEEAAPAPLSKVHTRSQEQASADTEPPERECTSPDMYRYRPDVATGDLFKPEKDVKMMVRRSASLRAEQLMSSSPPKGPPPTTRDRSGSHLRSASNPMQPSLYAPKTELLERPRTAPRADSVETTGSTPQTDTTDYPWSEEKASTAVTSAAITPARGSKRTSSQALQSGSEASSMPKVEPVDAEWMRQKLDEHKKAHEEQMQRIKTPQEFEAAALGVDTTPKQVTQSSTPNMVKMPARKPVPSRAASKRANESARVDSLQSSRPSSELLPSPSRRAPEPPRSTSRQDACPPRSESRQQQVVQRQPSRARSITRQVKDYIRPSSAQRNLRPEEASRPASRAGSVTRQVKEYFRPGTATGSRKPSMDATRPGSRSRSIDSFRSAASDVAPSVASTSSKWRTWRPLHRKQASQTSLDASRPGTSGSTTDSRGRVATRDAGDSPHQQKAKPAVNLNRELPPLPGLDQWKDEQPKKPNPVSSLASPVKEKRDGAKTPKSHRSQRSKYDGKSVTAQPEIGQRDDILSARMGSPTPPRSHKTSMDVRSAPGPPTEPPPAPPPFLGATILGHDDFGYQQLGPTTTIDPASINADVKKERRRSRSIKAAYPPEYYDKVQHASSKEPTAGKPPAASKGHLVNYSRVAGGPINGGLSRKVSKIGHVAATTNHTPVGHSRNNSDHHNFSRKFSMDEYSRMHDNRFQNIAEVSALKPKSTLPPKDKKWWQRMASKRPNQPSWMDQVVTSGSRSGVILTDDVAGAPIVRY